MAQYTNSELVDMIIDANGIDNCAKAQIIKLLRTEKKYGLVWENHSEEVESDLIDNIPVFVESSDKQILSNGCTQESAPDHIIIEGDNLQALSALCYTHEGKVDVIYIDPPYNTGNKDFIYNDCYVNSDDGYRHSKWISFIQKRLLLAHRLLSSRGVIFISIDDNEQANLKLLCDEIFGEDNFIANLVWQKKFSRSNDALYFSTMHDHILCYCKKNIATYPDGWHIGLLSREEGTPKGYSNPDNDPRGPWTSTIMSAKSGSASLLYPITTPSGKVFMPPSGRYWSCAQETFEQWKRENRIWFGVNGDASPRKKTFLSEVQEGLRPNSLILQEEGGNNQEGKQELKAIFNNEGVFDGPKPTKLIRLLLKIANCKDAVVLDFFAGSGTTMHATMQLNAEDGGSRQCILVTNNDNNICEDVTYIRNKRVIEGYTTPKGSEVEGLKCNNLRYFKVELCSRAATHQAKKQLFNHLADVLRIKENCYTEHQAFGSLDLRGRSNMLRYFEYGTNKMLLVYDDRVLPFVVSEIQKIDELSQPIAVYIFADGGYPYTEDFRMVMDKVSLIPMPYAVTHALQNVLPQMSDDNIDISNLSDSELQDIISGESQLEQ